MLKQVLLIVLQVASRFSHDVLTFWLLVFRVVIAELMALQLLSRLLHELLISWLVWLSVPKEVAMLLALESKLVHVSDVAWLLDLMDKSVLLTLLTVVSMRLQVSLNAWLLSLIALAVDSTLLQVRLRESSSLLVLTSRLEHAFFTWVWFSLRIFTNCSRLAQLWLIPCSIRFCSCKSFLISVVVCPRS